MLKNVTEHDRKRDAAITAYMQALTLGTAPSREEWLAAHPELAADLEEFLAGRDRLALNSPSMVATLLGDPAAPPAPGAQGRYIGDYELVEEIAHGGMGVIFRARQLSLGRFVALKMILTGGFASAATIQRFRSEAEAAAILDHPGIVPIYEIGDYQGQPYFSMKLIEGTSLKQVLPVMRQDSRRAVRILAAVARAVHFAHQHGIIHRDLKPGNVLIDVQDAPHLTDF